MVSLIMNQQRVAKKQRQRNYSKEGKGKYQRESYLVSILTELNLMNWQMIF